MGMLPRPVDCICELFDTYFGIKLAHLVFLAAEQLSTNLQAESVTIQEATRGAEILVFHLKTLRTEAPFNCLCSLIKD